LKVVLSFAVLFPVSVQVFNLLSVSRDNARLLFDGILVVFELVLVFLNFLGGLIDRLFDFLSIIQEGFLRSFEILDFNVQFLFVKSQLLVGLFEIVILLIDVFKLIGHFGEVFDNFCVVSLKDKLGIFTLSDSFLP
jgi:hypothetical protein